ncbi:MAG: hypothetical protein H6858_00050 [Rhodospirillales bacterium]|nr:hypothetical protein [Alphaproteobacteria bacterium]MCB9975973.1 hypothetical protein [Rhodospirillales bacterium]
MKNPGLKVYNHEMQGEEWGANGPMTLRFAKPDGLAHGLTGKVTPGMLASEDTQLGVMLGKGEGALAVLLPDFPIPREKVEAIYREAQERAEESDIEWLDVLQVSWLTDLARQIKGEYFRPDSSPPTVQWAWNPDENDHARITRAEFIMKGVPNSHPYWILATPSADIDHDSFDL